MTFKTAEINACIHFRVPSGFLIMDFKFPVNAIEYGTFFLPYTVNVVISLRFLRTSTETHIIGKDLGKHSNQSTPLSTTQRIIASSVTLTSAS